MAKAIEYILQKDLRVIKRNVNHTLGKFTYTLYHKGVKRNAKFENREYTKAIVFQNTDGAPVIGSLRNTLSNISKGQLEDPSTFLIDIEEN